MQSLALPAGPTVYLSQNLDPWWNLSLENWLFRSADAATPLLLLWRNRPCVVMGRFQNPWLECKPQAMQNQDVWLVRRQSGGGTVYHDPGNLNISFINGPKEFDTDAHLQFIAEAMAQLGIKIYANQRHDLVCDHEGLVKKCSGSAFKKTKDRSIHHATLLIHADLGRLNFFLRPKTRKLTTKAIASVPSTVVNLQALKADLSVEQAVSALSDHFTGMFQARTEILSAPMLAQMPAIAEHQAQFSTWDWQYGETPQFRHQLSGRLSSGLCELCIECHKGMIQSLEINYSGWHPEVSYYLIRVLTGTRYEVSELQAALLQTQTEFPMYARELAQLSELLASEFE